MPYWLLFYTNPITLFVVFVQLEVVIKIVSHIRHNRWSHGIKWRLLIYVVLIIISTLLYYSVLFTDDSRESMVDALPIAELNEEQIARLEDVLDSFEEYDFITRFERKREDLYYIIWYRSEPHSLLDISVSFYEDKKEAIDSMQNAMRIEKDRKYTHITNGNDTEVLLFDSKMYKSHGVPVSYRYLESKIRLGNAVIRLSENPEYNQLDMNISSDFIKLLCEKLTQEEIR